jgi:hypothetical protein
MDDADGVEREANDSLSTSPVLLAAELSTMLLRWRPEGRCAASWITSETVSGVGSHIIDFRFALFVATPAASG